jgi:hypothetical protein
MYDQSFIMVPSQLNYHASMYNVIKKECCHVITLVLLLLHCTLKFCLKTSRNNTRGIT